MYVPPNFYFIFAMIHKKRDVSAEKLKIENLCAEIVLLGFSVSELLFTFLLLTGKKVLVEKLKFNLILFYVWGKNIFSRNPKFNDLVVSSQKRNCCWRF